MQSDKNMQRLSKVIFPIANVERASCAPKELVEIERLLMHGPCCALSWIVQMAGPALPEDQSNPQQSAR